MNAVRGAEGHDGFRLPGIVAVDYRNGGLEKGRSRHCEVLVKEISFAGRLIVNTLGLSGSSRALRATPRSTKGGCRHWGPELGDAHLHKRHSFKDNCLS